MTVKIAVPNKGRLSEATLDLFQKAGLRIDGSHERRLYATALDRSVTILFVRADDIPEYVQDGVVDLGVTGLDIVEESAKDVERLMDLRFGHCRLVLAVPAESPVREAKDLPSGARVATSFPRLTRAHFEWLGRPVTIVEVSGATEVTPQLGVADAITDLVSSGSTLAMNHLREVETILRSSAWVVGNRDALVGPREREIRGLIASLESVVAARGKRYLMANVLRARLDAVRVVLPGISGPTIMEIADKSGEWVAAHAVVDDADLARVMGELKALGATGILVLPIERLVP